MEISGGYFQEGALRIHTAFIRDNSERQRLEESLRASEEIYRQVFEAGNDALLLMDENTGMIIEGNHAAATLYGYSLEELKRMKAVYLSG